MTICFIKDVSSLLALASAVREENFERHVLAEREMVKYYFAFDHINYARYMSYQQVYLQELQRINSNAIMDLTQRVFGGSLSGVSFSCLHGYLITEIFSEQTKGTQVLTVYDLVQTWLKLTHGLLNLTSIQKLGKFFQIKYER